MAARRSQGARQRPAARLAVAGEPGTDLARVAKSVVLVDADEERSQVDRLAGARHPAADDELLLGPDLDLLPAIGPLAGDVGRAAVLGHDPLEPPPRAASKNAIPSASMCSLRRTRGSGRMTLGQETAAFLEWLVEERPAVEMEQVEDLVDERGRLGGHSPPLDAGLQEGEVGLALRVERDDLAVDDRLPGGEPRRRFEERAEVPRRRVLLAAGPQPDFAAVDDRLDPEAVPLDLEQPAGVVERRRDERREHRRDERRLGDAAGLDHRVPQSIGSRAPASAADSRTFTRATRRRVSFASSRR